MRALVVPDKAQRVYNFHKNTMKALQELLASAGLMHPCELGPEHIIRRISSKEIRSIASLHHWVRPGDLLKGVYRQPVFKRFWAAARHDSFAPADSVLVMRAYKTR